MTGVEDVQDVLVGIAEKYGFEKSSYRRLGSRVRVVLLVRRVSGFSSHIKIADGIITVWGSFLGECSAYSEPIHGPDFKVSIADPNSVARFEEVLRRVWKYGR